MILEKTDSIIIITIHYHQQSLSLTTSCTNMYNQYCHRYGSGIHQLYGHRLCETVQIKSDALPTTMYQLEMLKHPQAVLISIVALFSSDCIHEISYFIFQA